MSTSVPFFSVSIKKLIVMSVSTAGIYDIYWSYKHWHCIKEYKQKQHQNLKQTSGQNIHPRLFLIFSQITIIGLARRINREAHRLAKQTFLSPLWTFLIHTVLLFILTFQFIEQEHLLTPFYFIQFILSGLTLRISPLLLLQITANQVNNKIDNEVARNRSFSTANTIIALVSFIIIVFLLFS